MGSAWPYTNYERLDNTKSKINLPFQYISYYSNRWNQYGQSLKKLKFAYINVKIYTRAA